MPPIAQGFNASQSLSLSFFSRKLRLLSQSLALFFLAGAFFAHPAQAATVAPLITRPIDATQVQPLVRHHPAWAIAANRISAVPDDENFEHLTLVLARSAERQKAFEQLLADQQNPASHRFHKWLTPTEVGERYGASDADIASITGWLASQGLHVNFISPNRTLIHFGGSAPNIGRAFQTTLSYYKVRGEKRLSIDADPTIPQALAPAIQAVRGLFEAGEKPLLKTSPLLSSELTLTSGSHYLTPGDFNTIYDVPAAYTGAGVTIGIVGWARVSTVDLDTFRTKTGTSFPNPTVVVPTAFGGIDPGAAYTAPPTCTNDCAGGQGEATLDVIRAGGTAPGANLLLVASSSKGSNDGIGADTEYLVGTSPTPAQIITISFGACESSAGLSGVTYWDNLFKTAAAEGISVFVSSGDSAAAGCDDAFSTPPTTAVANSPNYICSSSYATCVGGTQFSDTVSPSTYWNSKNSTGYLSAIGYIPEGGWNESWDGTTPTVTGTGGGVSTIIATPSWQTGTGVPAARAGRYTPDVSFSASGHDGYFACLAASGDSTYNAGCTGTSWYFTIFSGTSASAPSMAGIAALLIQKTGSPQGNLNPALYALASSSASSSVFHDVTVATSGVSSCSIDVPSTCNNSIPGPTGLTGVQEGYLVNTGYDLVTGLGSLDVSNFLANYSNVATTATPTFTLAGSAVQVTRGSSNTSTITVTPKNGFTGTVTLKAVITSSPAGAVYAPTLSFGTGATVTLSGSTAQTATLTISTTATNTAAATPQPRPGSYGYSAGGAFLAGLILLSIPARSRAWKKVLGMLVLFGVLLSGLSACGGGGGGNSTPKSTGTTPGTYTITVYGNGWVTGTVTLTVQ